jgi:glycerol-3-phosphate dehydrogenase (NAD(P)+)
MNADRDYQEEGAVKEALNKWIPFMVRQAHHERNQYVTARPEPVEGLNQSFLKEKHRNSP